MLIPTALEEIIPDDHPVRLVDEILNRLDWTTWEATYHGAFGQPPIHPSVMAKNVLFALIRRIRSSRQIEYELKHSIDFSPLPLTSLISCQSILKRSSSTKRRSCMTKPPTVITVQRVKCYRIGPPRGREVSDDEHEGARRRQRERMKTPSAQEAYSRCQHFGENPFAVIKVHFDLRRFLLRGREESKNYVMQWRFAMLMPLRMAPTMPTKP